MSKSHMTFYLEPDPEGFDPEDVEEGLGVCDAAVLISIQYPEDGSYKWNLEAKDGRTGEDLDGDELWKAWLMLTRHLSFRADMRPGKADVCRNVHAQVLSLLRMDKPPDPEEVH